MSVKAADLLDRLNLNASTFAMKFQAHLARIQAYPYTLRLEILIDMMRDIGTQLLLKLRPPGIMIDHARESAKPGNELVRPIFNIDRSKKWHKMVTAEAVKWKRFQNDDIRVRCCHSG